jgi:hypothetical protein
MLELRANPGPTGRLLRQMLAERGLLTGAARGVVNYGHGGPSNLPTLNARAGTFNKLRELELLRAKGVATVPFSRSPMDLAAPVMGRSLHHTRGNDIIVYRTRPDGRILRPQRAHDFYTQLIEKQREYRIWSFRRTVIGCYEKLLEYPAKFGRRGRSREVWNYRNGYAYIFQRPEQVAENLRELARQAVDAVGLDFGAVDLIVDRQGRGYVLEVNSAPGVEGPRQGMTSLVNHIETWARRGFKRRNGEERE